MSVTLTDRYLYAVARHLPAPRRPDVERELRATIADDVEARVAAGAEPADAERAALAELGEPIRLAAGYIDRPQYVVGPTFYLPWLRLVRLLYVIVLPIVAAASIAGHVLSGTAPIAVFGLTWVTVLTVAVHLAFWTALVFWLIERSERDLGDAWSLDELPTPPTAGPALPFAGMVTIVGHFVLLAVLIVLQQQVSGFVDAEGRTIPILLPGLWTWALPVILGLIGAEIALTLVLWRAERWTRLTAALNALVAVAAVALVAWLILGPGLFNPEWFAQFGAGDDVPPLLIANVVTLGLVAGVGALDAGGGLVDLWRQRRRPGS